MKLYNEIRQSKHEVSPELFHLMIITSEFPPTSKSAEFTPIGNHYNAIFDINSCRFFKCH